MAIIIIIIILFQSNNETTHLKVPQKKRFFLLKVNKIHTKQKLRMLASRKKRSNNYDINTETLVGNVLGLVK